MFIVCKLLPHWKILAQHCLELCLEQHCLELWLEQHCLESWLELHSLEVWLQQHCLELLLKNNIVWNYGLIEKNEKVCFRFGSFWHLNVLFFNTDFEHDFDNCPMKAFHTL